MDSLSSQGDDPELVKILEDNKRAPIHGIIQGPLSRGSTPVRQSPYTGLSKKKNRRRTQSAPTYLNNSHLRGTRSLSDLEAGIMRENSFLTLEERQMSPNMTIYLNKVGRNSGPLTMDGGKKIKRKTKKYKKRTRKSRNKRKI